MVLLWLEETLKNICVESCLGTYVWLAWRNWLPSSLYGRSSRYAGHFKCTTRRAGHELNQTFFSITEEPPNCVREVMFRYDLYTQCNAARIYSPSM
jgi:hypothetical protein